MGHRASQDADVLFSVLHAEEPVTIVELAERLELCSSTITSACTRLWREGYLIRRRRENGGTGADPYEYVVAPGDHDYPPAEGVACSECGQVSRMLHPGMYCVNGWCDGVFEPT